MLLPMVSLGEAGRVPGHGLSRQSWRNVRKPNPDRPDPSEREMGLMRLAARPAGQVSAEEALSQRLRSPSSPAPSMGAGRGGGGAADAVAGGSAPGITPQP